MTYDYNYTVDSSYVPGWKTTRDADARALLFGPQQVYNQLGDIANNGIFGQRGIDEITKRGRASTMLDINQALRYGAPGFAGRVGGADSGAYRASIINRVAPTAFSQNAKLATDLTTQNYLSKIGGIQGLMQMLEFFQTRKEKGKSGYAGQGSGAFDKVLGALMMGGQLASLIPTGGASAAASAPKVYR